MSSPLPYTGYTSNADYLPPKLSPTRVVYASTLSTYAPRAPLLPPSPGLSPHTPASQIVADYFAAHPPSPPSNLRPTSSYIRNDLTPADFDYSSSIISETTTSSRTPQQLTTPRSLSHATSMASVRHPLQPQRVQPDEQHDDDDNSSSDNHLAGLQSGPDGEDSDTSLEGDEPKELPPLAVSSAAVVGLIRYSLSDPSPTTLPVVGKSFDPVQLGWTTFGEQMSQID